MLSSNFVATAFRIINFFVVLFLFIYLFRRYFLKSIKSNIEKIKNYFASLKIETNNLDKRSQELDFEISYQEYISKDLFEKVYKWKQAYKNELDIKKSQQEQINKKIEEKLKLQENVLTYNQLKCDVLKSAVEKARAKLLKEFHNKEAVSSFQKDVISFMNRN